MKIVTPRYTPSFNFRLSEEGRKLKKEECRSCTSPLPRLGHGISDYIFANQFWKIHPSHQRVHQGKKKLQPPPEIWIKKLLSVPPVFYLLFWGNWFRVIDVTVQREEDEKKKSSDFPEEESPEIIRQVQGD